MPAWILQTGLSLLCFGLWGFFSKLALDTLAPKSTLMWQTVGILLVTALYIKPTKIALQGSGYATLTGIAFAVGSIAFFAATKDQGKIAMVVTITALYPIVTIGLAWAILQEPVTLKQSCGIILALMAMYLMAQ